MAPFTYWEADQVISYNSFKLRLKFTSAIFSTFATHEFRRTASEKATEIH